MKIPYPRPTTLSDPYCDFTSEMLVQLLSTSDELLEWQHLQSLLGPFLPAGTYQESVYFLPLAFDYLCRNEESALDLTTSVTWFISEYADNLAEDGLLDECRSKIFGCLQHWIRDFTVSHFDEKACSAKGWKQTYFDCVQRSAVVCETLCDLDQFERHADLADLFISELVSSVQPVSAAWFLELARSQNAVYHPPNRKVFQGYFADRRLLAQKKAILAEYPLPVSPSYWSDMLAELGLEDVTS